MHTWRLNSSLLSKSHLHQNRNAQPLLCSRRRTLIYGDTLTIHQAKLRISSVLLPYWSGRDTTIGESPGSITFTFRNWKEQTAWSLVGGNAERLICPNQDFSILFVTIFACLLVSPRSSFLLSVSRPGTQPRGLLTNSSLDLQH